MDAFTIGHAARSAGTKVQTVRYYEQIGLLPPPDRSDGNQRLYSRAEIARLGFIRHARGLALLLFCVVGACWLSGETTISVAHAADAAAPRGAVPSNARPDTGAAAATPSPSTAGPVRATAAAASASGLPFPADATWVPVLVVDKVTRAPVAGAEVGWVGETIEAYFESMDQFDVDTIFVWRSLDLQIDRAGWRTTTARTASRASPSSGGPRSSPPTRPATVSCTYTRTPSRHPAAGCSNWGRNSR